MYTPFVCVLLRWFANAFISETHDLQTASTFLTNCGRSSSAATRLESCPNFPLILRGELMGWMLRLIGSVHRPGQIAQFRIACFSDLFEQSVRILGWARAFQPFALKFGSSGERSEMFERQRADLASLIRGLHRFSERFRVLRPAHR